MQDSIFRFSLDIHCIQSQVSLDVPMTDTARRLIISLTEKGKPYLIEDGCKAVLTGDKADGTSLVNECTIENNIIQYQFTNQTTSAFGAVECQIKLYGANGRILTSPRFTLVVHENTGENVVVSEDENTVFDGILLAEAARVEAEKARVEAEEARGKLIADLQKNATSSGTVTIPVSEWSDNNPAVASFYINGFGVGMTALLYPADEASKQAATEARISAYPSVFAFEESGLVEVIRAETENAPTAPITFDYIVIKTESTIAPKVAIIGVDANGGSEGSNTGGVDANAVLQIIKDNIANELKNYYPRSQTYSRTEIDNKVSAVAKVELFKVVASLPTSDISTSTVYLVKGSGASGNIYTEYIYANGSWEIFGTHTIVLSDYITEDELDEAVNAALSDYLTEKKAAEMYQPKGNYLTQSDLPTIPSALPSPKALTILGKTYTGAEAVSITVDDLIASLPDGSEVEY